MSGEKKPSTTEQTLRRAIRLGAPQLLSDLCALVRIPSVSWSGFDPETLNLSSALVRRLLEETGLFDSVGVYQHGGGAPAVVARREPQPGWPTVVLYAHHDVQPPGNAEAWESEAYQPSVRNHRLYGRGTADDKAGIAVHLGALRAVSKHLGAELKLGVVVFVEGEEENGSPSFPGFIDEHRDLLRGDIIVVADSDNPSTSVPAVTTRLRGNVTAVLTVKTLDHAVHSGMLGGAVPDAMMAFVRVAHSFYNPDGGLAVAGLDQTVDESLGHGEPVGEEAGLLPGVSEIGVGSVSSRLWDSPALTITGLDVPTVEHASNTLLPSVRAKLSLRVAPTQRADSALRALEAHVGAWMPFGAQWELTQVSLGEGFQVDESSSALELAKQALAAGFGVPAVTQGVGGSIPFISTLAEKFPQAHVVVTGVEDPETRAHSPNESLDLGVLHKATLSEALLLVLVNDRKVSDFAHSLGVEYEASEG
jgi:acetylornithine deacetylase/succinyl-diaminopimelate desuccinylase-like protein